MVGMEPLLGRRERNKAAKRAAISRAAADLFALRGYAGTTTQQVARAADIAEGTLFRYAETKPELLLMVIHDYLRPLVEQAPEPSGSLEDDVLALLNPIIELAEDQPGNAAPILREVLFGEDGPQRRAVLELVEAIVERIVALLRPYEDGLDGMDLDEVARWIFSTLVSELLHNVIRKGSRDEHAALRARVRVLLRGLGAA